jgi:hypothetical protein
MKTHWQVLGGVLLIGLTGCPNNPVMEGTVVITHPDSPPTTVHVTCNHLIDYQSGAANLTALQVPITSVIKPQIGGFAIGENVLRNASDAIGYLDYNQLMYCEALLLSATSQERDQVLNDYRKANGDLATILRALQTASTQQQYQNTVNKAAETANTPPSPTTTAAVNQLKAKTEAGTVTPTTAPVPATPSTPAAPTAPAAPVSPVPAPAAPAVPPAAGTPVTPTAAAATPVTTEPTPPGIAPSR